MSKEDRDLEKKLEDARIRSIPINTSRWLLWLVVVYIYLNIQGVLIGISLIGASDEVLEQSLRGNIQFLPLVPIVYFPTLLMYLGIKKWEIESKVKKVAKVLLIIFVAMTADVIFYYTGGYSVLRNVDNYGIYKAEEAVKNNHPGKEEGSVRLITSKDKGKGEYYYNTESQDLYYVKEDEIVKVDKEKKESEDYIYEAKIMGEDRYFDIGVKQTGGVNKEGYPEEIEITIGDGDYVYRGSNGSLYHIKEYFEDINIENVYGITKEGDVLYIEERGIEESELELRKETITLVLIRDDEVTLIRALKTDEENLRDIGEKYVSEGSWKAYINSYSEQLLDYVRVSEYEVWENE